MRRLCMLLMTGLLCACGAEQPTRGWGTSVDTLPSGTVRFVNHPPPATVVGWSLEEVLRVGTIDGDGPESFVRISGLAVLDDERFAVLDGTTQEVKVFAADGSHVATHGRKGGGPGEFEAAFGLMRDSRGLLWVPDHRNGRMTVLDPDLGYQWSAPLQLLTRGFIWQGAMLDSDHVWKPSITLGPPQANVMRVYSPEAELVDSLALPQNPDIGPEGPPGAFVLHSSDGRPNAYFQVPFFPPGETLIDPAGAIWSTAYGDPSYRIARWEPEGDTTLVIETLRPPVSIPASERDAAISVVREVWAVVTDEFDVHYVVRARLVPGVAQ